MEKTFVDWYLLGIDSETNYFTDQILSHIDGLCQIEALNAFELCLLIELSLKKGTPKMIDNAKTLAKKLIDK